MADTPESIVYGGRVGSGAAQVFGREGNPMRAYYQRKQDVERKQAIADEQARLAKEKRDKKMWEMVNVDPEKAFAPFNQQVLDAASSHRKKITEYFERGGNPDDLNFQMEAKKGWDEINDMALRTNYVKDVLKETKETIEKDPYLNYEYYFPKINDLYLDEKGQARPIDEIDIQAIRNVYSNDPMGFNEVKYQKDFMDALNENMTSYIRQKATNNGILTTDGETKWKGDVYIPDPNSKIGVKVDENGDPIINITPELVNSFTNSETAKRYYSNLAQQQGVDIKDIVKARVAGLRNQEKHAFTKDSNWMFDYMLGGKLKPDELKLSSRVFEHIDNITNAFFDKDGKRKTVARPEAREALGHLVGTRFGSGVVADLELVPGTNRPGRSTHLGKAVENSPNDRLLMKIKSGTRGFETIEEIDLADEGAPSSLWNNFRDSNYMGKKNIAFDAAAEQLQVDPRGLYKGREYVGQRQLAEQERINKWVEGTDYEGMVGKNYNGKPISKVTKDTSWLGDFKGYTLQFADGTTAKLSPDDYEKMTDIYRSEAATPSKTSATGVELAGEKKSGVKWE